MVPVGGRWIQSNLKSRPFTENSGGSLSHGLCHSSIFPMWTLHLARDSLWLRRFLASPGSTSCGESMCLDHWPRNVVQLLPWAKVQRYLCPWDCAVYGVPQDVFTADLAVDYETSDMSFTRANERASHGPIGTPPHQALRG